MDFPPRTRRWPEGWADNIKIFPESFPNCFVRAPRLSTKFSVVAGFLPRSWLRDSQKESPQESSCGLGFGGR
jgi:hypothetical protein